MPVTDVDRETTSAASKTQATEGAKTVPRDYWANPGAETNRSTHTDLEHYKAEEKNTLGPIQLWLGCLIHNPSILAHLMCFFIITFYISYTQLALPSFPSHLQ